jgi:hypothetical protein
MGSSAFHRSGDPSKCGRFTQRTNLQELARQFDFHFTGDEPPPRYNVAPTQEVAIVRGNPREFALARWGLIPSWAKDAKIAYNTINARADTAATKPAFRSTYKHRRCLVLADGYYEWLRQQRPQSGPEVRGDDLGIWRPPSKRGPSCRRPAGGHPGDGQGGGRPINQRQHTVGDSHLAADNAEAESSE